MSDEQNVDSKTTVDDSTKETQETKYPQNLETLPDWAQGEIKRLRTESQSKRETAMQAEQRLEALQSQIAQTLGLKEAPTVDGLQEQLEKAQKQAQQQAREFEVFKTAQRHGVDPEVLLDSKRFSQRLEAGEDLDTIVSEYKPKEEPKKEEKKVTKSGPDFSGTTSKPHIFTSEEISKMSKDEFAKHREAILKQQSS